MPEDLPVVTFHDRAELRRWLEVHGTTSAGVWVRVAKLGSDRPSVRFEEILEEGLCFGWSESTRRAYDERSYLQKFTPRRKAGTASARNLRIAQRLVRDSRMTPAGAAALTMTGPLERDVHSGLNHDRPRQTTSASQTIVYETRRTDPQLKREESSRDSCP